MTVAVKVWDVGTGQERATFTTGQTSLVTSVALSGDGKTLVSGSEDKTVKVWDVDTGSGTCNPQGPYGDGLDRGVERRWQDPRLGQS